MRGNARRRDSDHITRPTHHFPLVSPAQLSGDPATTSRWTRRVSIIPRRPKGRALRAENRITHEQTSWRPFWTTVGPATA